MHELFSMLSHAVEGPALVAVLASLLWGVLSIILSPCHLASLPLIVGFVDQQGQISTRRAFTISLLFAAGLLVTIAVIGAVTAAAGRLMGDIGRWGNYVIAVIFFAVGLQLMGVIPAPWSRPAKVGMKRKGLGAAFVLGLVFGIALGPCTFAFMAPVLATAFKLASGQRSLLGGILLASYGVGHCAVIVLAGTGAQLVQRYLDWNEESKGARILRRACGVLVLLGGLYYLYTSL